MEALFLCAKNFEKRLYYKVRHGTAPSEFKIYIFRGGGRVFCRFCTLAATFWRLFSRYPLPRLVLR